MKSILFVVMVGVIAGGGVNADAIAQSADAIRGGRLYDTACTRCHGRSVHDRKQRSAQTFDDIVGYVRQWSGYLSLPWTDSDVRDVALYLNERYYQHPCPTPSCKQESARLERQSQ